LWSVRRWGSVLLLVRLAVSRLGRRADILALRLGSYVHLRSGGWSQALENLGLGRALFGELALSLGQHQDSLSDQRRANFSWLSLGYLGSNSCVHMEIPRVAGGGLLSERNVVGWDRSLYLVLVDCDA